MNISQTKTDEPEPRKSNLRVIVKEEINNRQLIAKKKVFSKEHFTLFFD